ncbi:MAG: hypothetical protein M1531_02950 [Chloroflexi bacterium]|nr:hypothetical protein [Chloroflexota bacterium]
MTPAYQIRSKSTSGESTQEMAGQVIGNSDKIGEVIEANTTGYTAECYQLHCAPASGSFVAVRDGTSEAYGVVSNIETTSLDPGRRALARGRDEADPEDVYRHNPELPELLRTQFEVVTIGYAGDAVVRCYLPPLPPRLHAFVYSCPPEVTAALTADLRYLQTLLSSSFRSGSEELVAACVRQAAAGREDGHDYLVSAGKELARLLVNDPLRLNAILRRMAS